MALVSRDDIKQLAENSDWPCVSIYMPTHRTTSDIREDTIRLKDLIKDARNQLLEAGVRSTEANELLSPIEDLLDDTLFWQHQRDALALFSSKTTFRYYRLPISVQDVVVVTGRFHVKPLLSLLSGNGQFYVLALSQNQVRLLQCTESTVEEVELEDIPSSLAEVIRPDERERLSHFHTTAPGAGKGGYASVFHGWAFGKEDKKEEIFRFFQRVDDGVSRLLSSERTPLVLACVDYLKSIYREANRYPYLFEECVAGNPDEKSDKELQEEAWAIVRPHFEEEQREAAEKYGNAKGTGLASNQIKEIVPGAFYGRVEVLFSVLGAQIWGTFAPESGAVEIHTREEPGAEDLADFAAVHTLLNGGNVYVVNQEDMPEDGNIAAVFRY